MPAYTLRQLAYFVAVAEAGSISGAATKLHVTPTAVASAMTDRERVLRAKSTRERNPKRAPVAAADRPLRQVPPDPDSYCPIRAVAEGSTPNFSR
jgi:hypothetical protein